MADVDRAITDGDTEGFLKIHCKEGTDTILGATIVARHAGEMISEITTAMVAGMGLGSFSGVIHPYPTQAEVIRKAADAYNRTKLTPTTAKILNRWFSWTR
jgi:pyruvate/2-oxoglutarate dehydrogenase complex dihydrolipoamide dehydrogenase (E3) component